MENLIIVLVYSIAAAITAAKYNASVLAELQLKYTLAGREEERKAWHKRWHRDQLVYRGIGLVALVYALAGLTWEAVALGAVAEPVMWIFFNHSLNLWRGLGFFHKGKNDLDMVYRFDFMFFLFEVFGVLCGVGVWYVLNYCI